MTFGKRTNKPQTVREALNAAQTQEERAAWFEVSEWAGKDAKVTEAMRATVARIMTEEKNK